MRPDPPQSSPSLNTLTDKELMPLEKVSAGAKQAYIPSFPQSVIQGIVEADAVVALPLVLAIHRQLTATRRDETPLNEAIWKCAGSPSAKRREVILRKLKTIPHVIRIIAARTATTHYRVAKGKLWQET